MVSASTSTPRIAPTTKARPIRLSFGIAASGLGLGLALLAMLVARDGEPVWRAVRFLAVVAIGVPAVAVVARRRGHWRARVLGMAGATFGAVGAGFLPHLAKDGLTPVALAAAILTVLGVGMVASGVVLATRGRRLPRRLLTGAGAFVATVVVAYVASPPIAATNVPRPSITATPESVGLAYETVTVATEDGLTLAGWYVPSTNGAAVALLHGAGSTRSNVLSQADVLAAHGYGVLMIDARGHGDSEGRAMDFGWHGDADIRAATDFLRDRDDVDPSRIGLVGMSMGGEEAIGATATNAAIRAVVAEGATARSARDETWLSDEYGFRGAITEPLEALRDRVTDLLSSASPPVALRTAVARAETTAYLLITAGDVPDERHAAAHVRTAAPHRVDVWAVNGAAHTDGLEVAPDDWERRVIAFLDAALR